MDVGGVDTAADDLLADGIVDFNLADDVSTLHIDEAAGGVGVEVDVQTLDIVDAHVEGDGNPVGGHTTLVAGGLKTDVGVGTLGDIERVGFTTLAGRNGNVVFVPLEGGMVGIVVDGLEVGSLTREDMPVAFDGNLGSVVDGEVQAANGVAAFGIADTIENLGLGGRGGVGLTGEGPVVVVASSFVEVFVGFMFNHDMEGGNGIVAVVDGETALGNEGGVGVFVKVLLLAIEREVVAVANGNVDIVATLANLRIRNVEDEGVIGDAAGIEVGAVERLTVLVEIEGAGGVEIGGVFTTGYTSAGVEGVHVMFAGLSADGVVAANDIQSQVADLDAGGGGVGVGVDAGGLVGVAVPGVFTAVVNEDGVVLGAGETGDADGYKAVAAAEGGTHGAIEDTVGVGEGVGLTKPGQAAAGDGVDDGNVGGIIERVNDNQVDGMMHNAFVDSVDGGVETAGGEGVVTKDVKVAGDEFDGVVFIVGECGNTEADGAVATVGRGEGHGVNKGVADDDAVPDIATAGSDFLGGHHLVGVDGDVESGGISAMGSNDGGVNGGDAMGQRVVPRGDIETADNGRIAENFVSTQGDINLDNAVATVGGGQGVKESTRGLPLFIVPNGAASTGDGDGSGGVVGGGQHGKVKDVDVVTFMVNHRGVGGVGDPVNPVESTAHSGVGGYQVAGFVLAESHRHACNSQ